MTAALGALVLGTWCGRERWSGGKHLSALVLDWVAEVGMRGLQEQWPSFLYIPQPQGKGQELEPGRAPHLTLLLKVPCSPLFLSPRL